MSDIDLNSVSFNTIPLKTDYSGSKATKSNKKIAIKTLILPTFILYVLYYFLVN